MLRKKANGDKQIMREVRSYYYEKGSSAHKLETLREYEERLKRQREEEKIRRRERAKANARVLRRKKTRIVQLGLGIVTFGIFFCANIYLQNGITTSMRNISSLEGQIQNLKAENAAVESRISTSTDLESVKKTAMEKLGMVYAKRGQIVYYTMEDEDYMSQYGDVE